MSKAEFRPDPDELLKVVQTEQTKSFSGKLRVFLGMSAGVGKTYTMLKAAHQKKNEGLDVVIGIVETHGRSETSALVDGLEVILRKKINYRGTELEEMDSDEILRRRPQIVLVDELAHTNVSGSRYQKRYQDVIEFLKAGIDVYTALNVQHIESRKDHVEQITGVTIRETVPDSILEVAELVELIDIAPSELLKRLAEGKVYLGDKAATAAAHFFQEDKLTALREIALRITADKVDRDLQRFPVVHQGERWLTNEKLLVALSHSPFSEKLIRATRRLSYSLGAPWLAVYVRNGLNLTEEDQRQLYKNMNLARELGAEVITVSDPDVATAVSRIARQKNVTQILVGRPGRKWLRNMIEGGSFLEKLMRLSSDLDVHVICYEKDSELSTLQQLMLYRSGTGWVKYYYVFWLVAAVTMFGALSEPYIGYRAVGFLFFLGVTLAGILTSTGAVIFSAFLSAVTWNYCFIPPRFTFVISSPEDIILCLSFFTVAVITGFLTNRIRIREKLIREREEKTNLMNLVLKDLTESRQSSECIKKIAILIDEEYQGKTQFFIRTLVSDPEFSRLADKEKAVAVWSYQNAQMAGWSTDTLSEEKSLYIPLMGGSEKIGLCVFKPMKAGIKLSIEKKDMLLAIITQLALSLERYELNQRLEEAQRIKQSEVLHQTLLNSISHEIRTPLTAIMGATSALQTYKAVSLEVATISDALLGAGVRLNRVIENLLDMSRLNSGVLALQLEWHDLSDLVGVVLQKLDQTMRSDRVEVSIADDVGLVKIDFRLFEHALSNLLVNSLQYAGENAKILVSISTKAEHICLSVEDDGIGIPSESITQIFDKFYRVPGTPSGGTGLGLSIVKSIVELHHGHIRYENRTPRGARFIVELPVGKSPAVPPESET